MKIRKKIEKAILDVSPSLEDTKLCKELVDTITKCVKKHIKDRYAEGYSDGKRRERHPIEYADFR